MEIDIKEESLELFEKQTRQEKLDKAVKDLFAVQVKVHDKKTKIEILEQQLVDEKLNLEKILKAQLHFMEHRNLKKFEEEIIKN